MSQFGGPWRRVSRIAPSLPPSARPRIHVHAASATTIATTVLMVAADSSSPSLSRTITPPSAPSSSTNTLLPAIHSSSLAPAPKLSTAGLLPGDVPLHYVQQSLGPSSFRPASVEWSHTVNQPPLYDRGDGTMPWSQQLMCIGGGYVIGTLLGRAIFRTSPNHTMGCP